MREMKGSRLFLTSMQKKKLAPSDTLTVLNELRKRLDGRIRSITLYDGNVCSWTHPPDRTWESIPVSGDPLSKQLMCAYRGRKIKLFANRQFLNTQVAGCFGVSYLSINRKNANNPLLRPSENVVMANKEYPTFTKSGMLSAIQKDLLAKVDLLTMIRALDMQARESIHFAEDCVSLYCDQPSLSRAMNALESLIDLAESVNASPQGPDLERLPDQFRPLVPLIGKWAIGDDLDREDLLVSSPGSVLQELVDTVEPYLKSIDAYLDSFIKQPPSEEAAALGRLAECAAEAKMRLLSGP